jgi:hypothetical protein
MGSFFLLSSHSAMNDFLLDEQPLFTENSFYEEEKYFVFNSHYS